ncbi:MAG TPA: hypothetical protein EYP55_09560, partial [Anaerolineae bacterium]|nr:hypothetical protein [Anaerolineae bacterium]
GTEDLFDIHFVDADHGWIAGANGTILHTANGGVSWVPETIPYADSFHVLFMFTTGEDVRGWVLGQDRGDILYYDGQRWDLHEGMTGYSFSALSMTSPEEGWATTLGGQLVEYRNNSWGYRVLQRSAGELHDVHLVSDSHGWAVGERGTLLYYDGSDWMAITSQTNRDLFGIHVTGTGRGWAVGERGTLLYYEGDFDWSDKTDYFGTRTHWNLRDVYLDESALWGWAVGENGLILKYTVP